MVEEIRAQAAQAMEELLEQAKLHPGELMVVGCSSSEIMGQHIGKGSSMEAAARVRGAFSALSGAGRRRSTVRLAASSTASSTPTVKKPARCAPCRAARSMIRLTAQNTPVYVSMKNISRTE